MAVAYSALANGGTVVRPHVGKAVLNSSGQIVRSLRFRPVRHAHLFDMSAIRDGLFAGAHSGTSAAVFGTFPVPVAGKTGTAEAPPGSDHSWYGGFGAEAAAPAAKEIYSAFFGVKAK
jgi:penicillin-binding protein 2